MLALTVIPHGRGASRMARVREPDASEGSVLVETHWIGLCGTDRDIVRGAYGSVPRGERELILGHESIGRVREAPPDSGLAPGDWVVGMVRRPCPERCPACASGEYDMCQSGGYTEHGIRGQHGFGRQRYRIDPEHAVPVPATLGPLGVLVEPASVVVKAWAHADRIGGRAYWRPKRLLVTGAGPVGLLAALVGARRGMQVDVLDRVREGRKPHLVRRLGARYCTEPVDALDTEWDLLIECTGAPQVLRQVLGSTRRNGVVCLMGMPPERSCVRTDTAVWSREAVLENNVIFGTVSANRAHYEAAVRLLAQTDPTWLADMVTRQVPITRWRDALAWRPHDVKVVLDFNQPPHPRPARRAF